MEEYTTVPEFKERARKPVLLPDSKLKVIIRRIPPRLLPDIAPEKPIDFSKLSFQERRKAIKEFFDVMVKLFPICVVSPKIVINVNPVPEDAIDFDDLTMNDLLYLLGELFSYSGLTAEAVRERENFRKAG